MSKGSRRTATKGNPYGKKKGTRRKYQAARQPAPLAAKQVLPPKSVSTAPAVPVSPAPRIEPATVSNALSDLKRVGIVAGILLLLLIILYLVL
jgi:hypothetical protein